MAPLVGRADGQAVRGLENALDGQFFFEVFGGHDGADQLLMHQGLVELGAGGGVEVGELGAGGVDRGLEMVGKVQRLQLQLVALNTARLLLPRSIFHSFRYFKRRQIA